MSKGSKFTKEKLELKTKKVSLESKVEEMKKTTKASKVF
jgi:hypothetical protein